jgi:hypothetical protein
VKSSVILVVGVLLVIAIKASATAGAVLPTVAQCNSVAMRFPDLFHGGMGNGIYRTSVSSDPGKGCYVEISFFGRSDTADFVADRMKSGKSPDWETVVDTSGAATPVALQLSEPAGLPTPVLDGSGHEIHEPLTVKDCGDQKVQFLTLPDVKDVTVLLLPYPENPCYLNVEFSKSSAMADYITTNTPFTYIKRPSGVSVLVSLWLSSPAP